MSEHSERWTTKNFNEWYKKYKKQIRDSYIFNKSPGCCHDIAIDAWKAGRQSLSDKEINHADLMRDEFLRIKALTENPEIRSLCDRAIKRTDRNIPVIEENVSLRKKISQLEIKIAKEKED